METLTNASFLNTSETVTLADFPLEGVYEVGPVAANYSGNVLFPANYTVVRLLNSARNLSYTLDAVGSVLKLQDYSALLLNSSVVFVGGVDGQGGLTTFALTGQAVQPEICEGNPPLCAWYAAGDQLRTLVSPFLYACGESGTVVVQTTECGTPFQTWAPSLTFPQRV